MGPLIGSTQASIVVVTFNSSPHLSALFEALEADAGGATEVIVVDNASSDDSAALAEAAGARVIRLEDNKGFPAACHVGVDAATHEVVVLLNPDTVPRRGWLLPLVDALDDPTVGAASPIIELVDEPGHFNTSGGALAFYGIAWATDVGAPIERVEDITETPFPSGAAMAIRKETWQRLRGFRPDFFLYHEDSDLGWRLRLSGLRSVRVPRSLVAHDYEFERNPSKMFYLERNRLMMLRANYRTRTLLMLAPVLLMIEAGVLVIAVRDGWAASKVRSWGAAWRARKATRAWAEGIVRTISDAEMLETMQASPVGVGQLEVPLARPIGWLLTRYVALMRRIV